MGENIECNWAKPLALSGNQWDQDAEKLAKKSLVFTDKLTFEKSDNGVRVEPYDSGVGTK